jgi:alpha-1,2-mannosyltransferase
VLRYLALGLVAVFALINLGNALHKGGDFDVFLEGANRLLAGRPLYEGSSPGQGVIGPPGQSVFFVPFALLDRVSGPSTRVLWYAINLTALFAGAWLWVRTIAGPPGNGRNDLRPMFWASLAAVALPAQTNFEHQNMNALLLLLTGAGAFKLVHGRAWTAGAWLGLAAGLKVFPALLVVYLAWRRQWRPAVVATTVGLGLTFLPALWLGAADSWGMFREWTAISTVGYWPARPQNQSIFAAAARVAPDAAYSINAIASLGLILLLAIVGAGRRRKGFGVSGGELALALGCAVVLSPIAWDHYWVLLLPLFALAYANRRTGTWYRVAFWAAALLVTGPAPALAGSRALAVARLCSTSTIAALLLIGTGCRQDKA